MTTDNLVFPARSQMVSGVICQMRRHGGFVDANGVAVAGVAGRAVADDNLAGRANGCARVTLKQGGVG